MVLFFGRDVFETDPTEDYSALIAIKRIAAVNLLYLRAAAGTPLVLVPFACCPTEVIRLDALAIVPLDAAAEAHIRFTLKAAYLLLAVAARLLNQVVAVRVGAPLCILALFPRYHLMILIYFFVNAQFLFAAVFFDVRGLNVDVTVILQAPHFNAICTVY